MRPFGKVREGCEHVAASLNRLVTAITVCIAILTICIVGLMVRP
jgi:hypothetical protein